MKHLLLMLLLLLSPVSAEELAVEDFAMLVRHLPTAISESSDYRFNPSLADIATRLAAVTRVKSGDRLFVVDMKWVADVGEAMAGEQAEPRRKLLFVNMADTLNGMLAEFASGYSADAVSRQEMNDALERALGKTSEIRISGGVVVAESVAWCSRPGLVINQPGEAISLTGIQAPGGEMTSSGQVRGFSGTGWSGRASGGSTGDLSGNAIGVAGGSGFSSAGSAVGGVSVSGASGGMVRSSGATGSGSPGGSAYSGGSSVSISPSPVQIKTSAQSSRLTSSSATPGQASARPAEPPRVRPVPSSPPPKAPAPLRPPPKPKVGAGANVFFWFLMGVGVIGFVIIIFLIIKNLRRRVACEQARIELVERDLPVERMRSDTIYDRALREAEQGNYVEAIRLLTVGSLLLLEARRVINYQDSLTNGEYLRKLLVEKHLHSMFATPLALFDRLIYGFQSPDKKDFEIFRLFYLDLERLQK